MTLLCVQLSHKNASPTLTKLNACFQDVQQWMAFSKLELNPDKTEFNAFGSKAKHQKLSSHFPVNILRNLLQPVDIVRKLHIALDSILLTM